MNTIRAFRDTLFGIAALLSLGAIPASAAITAFEVAKDESITIDGRTIRHIAGVASGVADRNEPSVPTLDHVAGLKFRSDFELWLPAADGNGRFWFSVLNRGNDTGGLRDGILRRGGAFGWCAWQAEKIAGPRPRLKLTDFSGAILQAYGLVVIRDFVSFLRYSPNTAAVPNPAAGKIRYAFTYGLSQSARLHRSFLLLGLNNTKSGKVFDGLLPDGARAGYIDLFRPNSDPGSGSPFTAETIYAPYSWSDLMAHSESDAKVIVVNAESEYFEMMAYMTCRGPVPDNVRVFDFPLGAHGGGGPVPWHQCVPALSLVLEQWVCEGTKPPNSRMFTLEKHESPRARHLHSEPAELPMADEFGIALGGVRLPPVQVPIARYISESGGPLKPQPLDKSELTRLYGTPENYRKKVADTVDQLIQDRFLPKAARAKYVADAEKVNW